MILKEKKINEKVYDHLIANGIHPALASLFAARNIKDSDDLDYRLDKLLPPNLLTSNIEAGEYLADVIKDNKKIVIVGDYDADGATATACGMLGLKRFGADVDFIVPNRFEDGYGLTPKIVKLASKKKPDLIITVDNGIASIEGVETALALDIEVLITDHHLPTDSTPKAKFIINPNKKNCIFPSKNLCGVGVMFYLLLSLRMAFRKKNIYTDSNEPILSDLLDLVALGTVADLVKLDFNNRTLVKFGLSVIRSGKCNYGIRAILSLVKKDCTNIRSSDLSFLIAPKLNAAGRLDDMTLGIECLLSENLNSALIVAKKLIHFNEKRKFIENEMKHSALLALSNISIENKYSVVMFQNEWHQGVVGILASRIKEKYFRPCIIFAKGDDGFLKGSGRSIPSLNLRDALDLLLKKSPNLIEKFGGHSMAAGLTIKESNFNLFCEEFEKITRELISPDELNLVLEYDKAIHLDYFDFKTAKMINSEVWGQGFPAPVYVDSFDVVQQKTIAEKHTKCLLRKDNNIKAIFFNYKDTLPDRIKVAYSIDASEFGGNQDLQLIIQKLII